MPLIDDVTQALGIEPEPDGPTRWWVEAPTPDQVAAADELGLRTARRLHQMRSPLPLPHPDQTVTVRPFRPGQDDAAFLRTNNAAFHWHPDQSNWTPERLAAALDQPWVELDGFLVAPDPEHSDQLLGFCWTKFHPTTPAMGEIYVIGVHPDAHGRGLGRALTLAGFAWQWQAHQPPVGMLYVEASNDAAIGLYQQLGLSIHHDLIAWELP